MKETFIYKLEKHDIYYLSNTNFGFYILTPSNDEFKDTNISIRLKSNYENYDLNKNSIDVIVKELLDYYKDIDNYNITLVLPVFYDDTLLRIKTVNDMELFQKMDMILGMIFNESFKFLTKKGIKVENNIYLINNDTFKNFTNWFTSRYSNRVEYKTIVELVKQSKNYSEYDIVSAPSINFVVGKNEIPDLNKTVEMETQTFDDYVKETPRVNPPSKKPLENSGFVSYLFLGIVTFIVSLTLLYLLIK